MPSLRADTTPRHNLLRLRDLTQSLAAALIVAMATPTPAAASGHETIDLKTTCADTTIEVNLPFASLAWPTDQGFEAPYTVCQTSGSDTIFVATTNLGCFSVTTSKDVAQRVCVTSANGRTICVALHDAGAKFPWGTVLACAIVLMGCGVGIAIYARKQKKKLEGAQREIEESKVRHTRKYEFATVLFSDIQGFTKIAAHLNPETLVDKLDCYFIYFDELVDRYGVEKIKTIGDAYMCAGGVPDADSANPIEVTLVGLGMIAYVKERQSEDAGFWNIRVGINTGTVASGHIGITKKVFDIWGDTVNTASRMESGGEPGRVNVSESTYQKIQDYFECEYRGKMPVKYKGEIDMYFVNRLKEEYCQPGTTHIPNALMLRKMQILRIHDFEQMVRDTTLKDAHPNLLRRFDNFLARVTTLYTAEKMTEAELTTCGVASIFYFVKVNLPKDTTLSGKNDGEKLMRKMHLSEETREEVRRVVTHLTSSKTPEDRVEEVILDAAGEVWGRKDIIPRLMSLYEELQARGMESKSRKSWLARQKAALNEFNFHTDTARKLCEVPKAQQIEIIEMAMAM